ncbi:MAG: serine hydrolase domain-containing protein [Gammaproteobacteria bacterium]
MNAEAAYQARFETVMASGGFFATYQPREEIPGASNTDPLPSAGPDERSISDEALHEAATYAERNNSDAFMVWHDGKLQAEHYFGDTRASTPLISKSLSKPLTAIAVGRAIELGHIQSLDQPVADFILEWRDDDRRTVLVRHLLDMRSGFLRQGYSRDPDHPWNRAYLALELEDYLVNSYPLESTPGKDYLYNNATADMVAVLIERSTGQRYGEFIGREILSQIAAPGGEGWVSKPGGLMHSGCCKFLPAESWLRMARLLLDDGVFRGKRLLPHGYVHEMTTPSAANPHYGLGVWVGGEYVKRRGYTGRLKLGPQVLHSEPYSDSTLYLFDGNSNQVVYVLPQYNLIILRLGRSPPKEPEWDNAKLPNMIVRGLKQ